MGLLPSASSAQGYLRTQPGVYQLIAHLGVKVISTPMGILLVSGDKIDLQIFDLQSVSDDAEHLFLEFSASTNRYTKLHVGEQSYQVVGSFTLLMDDLRITVDNSAPYVSIVYSSEDKQALLGFVGTQAVVNSDREEGVALLEAHSFKKYALAGVQPYHIRNGEVLFRNKPLSTGRVGLALEQPRNECLESAVLVTSERLQALKNATSRNEVSKLFKEAVRESNNDTTRTDSLLLKVDGRNVVMWDYQQKRVIILQKVKFQSLSQAICEKKEIELG